MSWLCKNGPGPGAGKFGIPSIIMISSFTYIVKGVNINISSLYHHLPYIYHHFIIIYKLLFYFIGRSDDPSMKTMQLSNHLRISRETQFLIFRAGLLNETKRNFRVGDGLVGVC